MALFPDIFNAVSAALPAGITSKFGEETLAAEDAPPRVVWVPMSDTFGPAQPRGNVRADPRALHTQFASLEIHCWGASTAGALTLFGQLVNALRTTVGANYRLRSGTWKGQQVMTAGRVYVASLDIAVPVTETAPTVVTVTTETQTDFAIQH